MKVILCTGLGNMRYAVSADVTVEEGTFIQFDITMGCNPSKNCFSKYKDVRMYILFDFSLCKVFLYCLPNFQ